MLTFHKGKGHTEIVKLKQKGNKKNVPVMWSPVIKDEYRNSIDDLDYFFQNDKFRDRFELNTSETQGIKHALENNCVCEEYQKKYFKCKKFVYDSLDTEIDLSGTEQEFVFNFPPGGETYAWSTFVAGSSSAGKTHWVVDLLKRNLDGPKKDKRHFIYISNELEIDKTLQPLRQDKYREHFTGVDISEGAIESSGLSAIDYYHDKVKMLIDAAPRGSVCVTDDAMDSSPEVAELMRRQVIKLQRVGRHKGVGLIYLLHSLRAGLWSSTAYSSCRYIVVFPRSMKNRIRKLLEDEFGIPKREAERHIHDFAQSSRALIMRMHAPSCFLNKKLLRLI
jgi:hypothetical protein